MRGINKIIILGTLGRDPESQDFSGKAITSFSLATSETWKDKEGNKKESTEWHRCVCFGRSAEIARDYLHKGSKAYVEGSLSTRKWTDKEGRDRYTTEIRVHTLQLLDGRDRSQDSSPEIAQPAKLAAHDFDDDIPF